ncbi:MAG: metalloregulator ArsR/SmtB family transcription factor [Anaerolineales bacterium]
MDELMLARATRQAARCRLLGNACRLQILWSLSNGELSVNEIATRVGGSLQNVSQHLSLLKEHKLISSRRDGRHIYYHINDSEWLSSCIATSRISGERLEHIEFPTLIGG